MTLSSLPLLLDQQYSLKLCKSSLAKPLKIIWQSNVNQRTTQSILKTSHFTPIFKLGDQGAPENFRPFGYTRLSKWENNQLCWHYGNHLRGNHNLQLWSPSKNLLMQELEKTTKILSKRSWVTTQSKLQYWEKLKYLNLYSLERRSERYQIIYTWCIIEGLVPNFNYEDGNGGIYSYMNLQLGRKCKSLNTKKYLERLSLRLGTKTLTRYLCNTTNGSKLAFKIKLDQFLYDVPDEQLLQNYLYVLEELTQTVLLKSLWKKVLLKLYYFSDETRS